MLCAVKRRWSTARTATWEGRQVAKLPAVAGNGRTAERVDGRRPWKPVRPLVHVTSAKATDAIRHLQDREAPHFRLVLPSCGQEVPRYISSCHEALHSGLSAGTRRGGQCHPGMAGARQSRHNQPLRRNYPADKAGSRGSLLPSSRNFGNTPPQQWMA